MLNNFAIIIINWNSTKFTISCVESLYKHNFDGTIVVVDNNSLDEPIDLLFNEFRSKRLNPKVINSGDSLPEFTEFGSLFIIKSLINCGFSGGNNIGVKAVLGTQNIQKLWFLNNDTIVLNDTLSILSQYTNLMLPSIVYGTSVVDYYHNNKIQSIGGSFNSIFFTSKHNYEGFGAAYIKKLPEFYPVDYAPGCSFILDKSFFSSGYLFDERYFLYHEEIDLSLYIQPNRPCILTPVKIAHKGGGSTLKDSDNYRNNTSTYYYLRGRIIFASKLIWWKFLMALLANTYSILRRFILLKFQSALVAIRATYSALTSL